MKKLFFLIFLLSWGAYAELNIQCIESGYIDLDQDKIYYGANTYIRYDGECRPLKELTRDTWTYRYKKNRDNYEVCKVDKCILLPINDYTKYNFGFDKISFSIQYDNILNISDSKTKENCKEIILGYSNNWKREDFKWKSDYFIWDATVDIISQEKRKEQKKEKELHICENITKKHGLFIIRNNNLIYQICKADINKDNNSYEFIFNSYIIKGAGGNSTWVNGMFYNTTEKVTSNQLQLNWTINNLIFYANFDGGSYKNQVITDNDGSCSDCPTKITGRYQEGFSFTNSNNIDFNEITLGSSTLGGWVRFDIDNPSGEYIMMGVGSADNNRYMKIGGYTGKRFGIGYRTTSGEYHYRKTINSYAINTWYHFIGTINITSNELKIFINGNEWDTELVASAGVPSGSITEKLYVGRGGEGGDYLYGDVDDCRIYSGILSLEKIIEVKENYKYQDGIYISDNLLLVDDNKFMNITINTTKNGQNIEAKYRNIGGEWILISNNILDNISYNFSNHYDEINILLNLSTNNQSITPEINEIILYYAVSTTTTMIPILKHKYFKGDTTIQKTNNFIDEINIKHLIVIGLMLAVIFFYGIYDQLK